MESFITFLFATIWGIIAYKNYELTITINEIRIKLLIGDFLKAKSNQLLQYYFFLIIIILLFELVSYKSLVLSHLTPHLTLMGFRSYVTREFTRVTRVREKDK